MNPNVWVVLVILLLSKEIFCNLVYLDIQLIAILVYICTSKFYVLLNLSLKLNSTNDVKYQSNNGRS